LKGANAMRNRVRITLLFLFFFSFLGFSRREDPTVYVTRTGSKYHVAGCQYLRKSAIPMKLSEAVEGYSPCSRCNPPVLKKDVKTSKESTVKESTSSEKSELNSNRDSSHKSETAVGTTATGKTIYEGPRGGHYHYSKSGKKVYERKKK
jgi:hypothetical protein